MGKSRDRADQRDSACRLEISVLGHFGLRIDGKPLHFAAKAPRRPLSLLKLLAALGGERIPESELSDALWPNAEGDAAHSDFSATLHRLRKLIGPDALRLEDYQLSVDFELVRLDLRDFRLSLEAGKEAAVRGDLERASTELERALELYRGPLLQGEFEPREILPLRQQWHDRLIRAAEDVGQSLQDGKAYSAALSIYRRALEIEGLADAFYRGVMACHLALGRASEGLAAFERYRAVLKEQAGIQPEEDTLRLATALRQKADPSLIAFESDEVAHPIVQPARPKPEASRLWPVEYPTVAVLPFVADCEQAIIQGLASAVRRAIEYELGQYSQLRLLESANSPGRPWEAGRRADARYVVGGAIVTAKAKDCCRLFASLADRQSGAVLWCERFDGSFADSFADQDRIAREIAFAVDLKLIRGPDLHAEREHFRDWRTFRLWEKAQEELAGQRNPAAIRQQIAIARQLVRDDPESAGAWWELGVATYLSVREGISGDVRREMTAIARCADRAQQLAPELGWGKQLFGLLGYLQRDWKKAISAAERGANLPPWSTVHVFGVVLHYCDEPRASIGALTETLRLRAFPFPPTLAHLGNAYFLDRCLEQAIGCLQDAAALAPDWHFPRLVLAAALWEAGKRNEARAQVPEIVRLAPRWSLRRLTKTFTFNARPENHHRVENALRELGFR